MHDAPVYATVRTDHIRHNVSVLRAKAQPAKLMAVLKADAYGHGLHNVASLLQDLDVQAFAVARVHEAVALREAGVHGLILVLAPPTAAQLHTYVRYGLHVSVTSPAVAQLICTASEAPVRAHMKVDTGMHRLGISWTEAPSWWSRLHDASHVDAEGIYTHLATANDPDHPLNSTQLDRFASVVGELDPAPSVVHVANTDALFQLTDTLPHAARYARTGLGLYGLTSTPTPDTRNISHKYSKSPDALAPALSLETRVVHMHTVPKGETVSYGACWTAPADTCVATIGVGYGDGYPRAASGQAHVRIGGQKRPVVGTVCMDLSMVDLGSPGGTLAKSTQVGDPVVLFDAHGPTLHDVARWSGTIPYEVACQLATRVPRHYRAAPSLTANNGTI